MVLLYGTMELGRAIVTDGTATATGTAPNQAGTYDLTAHFLGTGAYGESLSRPVTITVTGDVTGARDTGTPDSSKVDSSTTPDGSTVVDSGRMADAASRPVPTAAGGGGCQTGPRPATGSGLMLLALGAVAFLRRRRLGLCVGAVGALAAWGNSAQAQATRGFAVDRFDPSERGSEWFANESLDLRGHLRPAVGLTADYAFKPLVIYNPDDSEAASLVRHQFIAHLGGSLILFNRLRLGVNLPIALIQDGTGWSSDTASFAAADSTALGDLRVGVDGRLYGNYKDPVTVALGAQVYLPIGSRDQYMSDGQLRLIPRLTVAGTVGLFTYAAKVGFAWRPQDDSFGGAVRGNEVVYSAAAGVRVLQDKLTVGPEIYGGRVLADLQGSEKTASPTEVILGAHYRAGDFRFGLGGGLGINRGLGAAKGRRQNRRVQFEIVERAKP